MSYAKRVRTQFASAMSPAQARELLRQHATSARTVEATWPLIPERYRELYLAVIVERLPTTPIAFAVAELPRGRTRFSAFSTLLAMFMGTSAGTRATKEKWIPRCAGNRAYLAAARAWVAATPVSELLDPTGDATGICSVLARDGSRRSLAALAYWESQARARNGAREHEILRILTKRYGT